MHPLEKRTAQLEPKSVARGIPGLPKHLFPFPVEYGFTIPLSSLEAVSSRLNAVFNSIHIQWQYRPSLATGVGFANENVWSRSARRRRQKNRKGTDDTGERHGNNEDDDGNGEDDDDDDDDEGADERAQPPKLGFKIKVSPSQDEKGSIRILVRWIRGSDNVIFESFCGMLRNKMMT